MWIIFLLAYVLAESVITLTGENFEEFIKENEKVLVEFYAPWCGHCKRLAPEYAAAAKELEAEGASTKLAKVDATAEEELADKYDIQGFPTLYYFPSGDPSKFVEFGGGRNKDSIKQWLSKRALPALSVKSTQQELTEFVQDKDDLILTIYNSETTDDINRVADMLRDYAIVVLCTDMTDDVTSAVELHTPFTDEPTRAQLDDLTEDNILDFFDAERFPPIDQIGPDNYEDYVDRDLPFVWIALRPSDPKIDEYLERLEPFAVERKGQLSFVWVDADKFSGHVEGLGVTIPGIMIIDDDENMKYKYYGSLESTEELTEFWTNYDAGELPSFFMSEPVPETNDAPVKIVVGSTFDQWAFDNDKHVFVKFYASWCGHCKKLAPVWEQLGESYVNRDDIVVAKIDATENDTPEDIEGFPTLILYKKGCSDTKCGIDYDDARDLKSLSEFLDRECPPESSSTSDSEPESSEENGDEKEEL